MISEGLPQRWTVYTFSHAMISEGLPQRWTVYTFSHAMISEGLPHHLKGSMAV